jgi:4-hydroxybenzoate polyprenyltransferase
VSAKLKLYLDLIRWDRPAGWLLLLWPTLSALWVASHGFPGWHLLGVFTLGTILMRSAGCCVNDVADRDFDKHVKRTANRPVTSGRISSREALALGAVLALAAFGLVLTTNATTVLWSFAALGIAIAYPFAKRFVSMPQAVLGVAFSFGIPMAFAAVQSRVPPLAWALLAVNLLWVLAYDTAYAMVDRDDDVKLSINTSAVTLGRFDVAFVTACNLLFIGAWCALVFTRPPTSIPALNLTLVLLGVGAALAHAAWQFSQYRDRSREGCFAAFRSAHWLGFFLFLTTALSYEF